MLAVSLTLWVLAQTQPSPGSHVHALLPGELIDVRADRLVYSTDQRWIRGEGHVVLLTQHASLKADELDYDTQSATAHAKGHVTFVSDLSAAVADELSVNLDTLLTRISGGRVFQKKNVDPSLLRSAANASALETLGTTTLVMKGSRFEKRSANEYVVKHLDFTPCDCDPLHPHWQIKSKLADVTPGDHAWLIAPYVYVYDVPLVPLPVMYVPLTERHSGLLVPNVTTSTINGWTVEAPVFVALGQSYDLTLTPGYFFGALNQYLTHDDGSGSGKQVPTLNPRHPAEQEFKTADEQSLLGVEGPELQLDFRYAPTRAIHGSLSLGLLEDLRTQRTPNTTVGAVGVPAGVTLLDHPTASYLEGTERGLRGQLSWEHVQDLGSGWHDRADISLLSDTWLAHELPVDIFTRTNEYSRSTATLYHSGDNQFLGLDAVVRQDLRYGYGLFDQDRQWGNAPRYGPDPLARLPGLTWAIPESKLVGPLVASLQVETERLSPLKRRTEDDGVGGYYYLDPTYQSAGVQHDPGRVGMGDGIWQPGEREPRDRIDLHPSLAANLLVGQALLLRPYAQLRDDLYAGENSGRTQNRGYALFGALASTELSREFKSPLGMLRHTVVPSVEARYVPYVFGSPLQLDDELDAALPYDPLHPHAGIAQAVAQVSQRLGLKQGKLSSELARLDLGQELDLNIPGYVGDAYGRGRFNFYVARRFLSTVSVLGELHYDDAHRRVSQANASLNLADKRGDAISVGYDGLLEGGSRRQRQGIDALVGTGYGFVDPDLGTRFASGNPPDGLVAVPLLPIQFSNHLGLGASVKLLWGLGLSYHTDLGPNQAYAPGAPFVAQQHTGYVTFAPACDCWRIEVGGNYTQQIDTLFIKQPASFAFKANVTISHFGSFGTGG